MIGKPGAHDIKPLGMGNLGKTIKTVVGKGAGNHKLSSTKKREKKNTTKKTTG